MQSTMNDATKQADDIQLAEAGLQRDPSQVNLDNKVLVLESHENSENGSFVTPYTFVNVKALQASEIAREQRQDIEKAQERLVIVEFDVDDDDRNISSLGHEEESICSYLRFRGLPEHRFRSMALPPKHRPLPPRTIDETSISIEWYGLLEKRSFSASGVNYFPMISKGNKWLKTASHRGNLIRFTMGLAEGTDTSGSVFAHRRSLLLYPQHKLCILLGFVGYDMRSENLERKPPEVANLRSNLSDAFQNRPGPGLLHFVVANFHAEIVDNENWVLRAMNVNLNDVERKMAYDVDIRSNISNWRSIIGEWRVHLHSLREQVETMKRNICSMRKDLTKLLDDGTVERTVEELSQLSTKLEVLELSRQATLSRCDSTFNALIGTMSILESAKAIDQAEEVTKLTQLAFVFIPLTFVAGIFGMNLRVRPAFFQFHHRLLHQLNYELGMGESWTNDLDVGCMFCRSIRTYIHRPVLSQSGCMVSAAAGIGASCVFALARLSFPSDQGPHTSVIGLCFIGSATGTVIESQMTGSYRCHRAGNWTGRDASRAYA